MAMLNALTIDVEDWYHPELVRPRLSHGEQAPQIEVSTRMVLELLRQRGVRATFFVVGEIAQRHPSLVEAIAMDGHELGCHGMTHKPLWEMTPGEFRSELERFSATMSTAAPGIDVSGFRAPTFSLDNRTRWALPILVDLGYHYDSSVFPLRTPAYGVMGAPLEPYRPSFDDVAGIDRQGALVEFPMSVWSWAGVRVPVCGGFYLRALPFRLVVAALKQISRRRPFVIYVHPWEFLADTPRVDLPFVARFVTYYNLGRTLQRLAALLEMFSFVPMKVALAEMGEL